MRRVGFVTAVVVLAGLSTAPALAGSSTKTLRGTFIEQAVTGSACASPVGLCASGQLRGGFHGPFDIVVTSTTPTTNPDVIVLNTSSVLHTKKGDVSFSGQTLYNTVTGNFSSVDTITGGTGDWAGVTGSLQSTGRFTFDEGGAGRYQAVVTRP